MAIVLGGILLVIAGGLLLLAVSSWPPGGLMFALPFVFLMPGLLFALVGAALVWRGGRPARVGPAVVWGRTKRSDCILRRMMEKMGLLGGLEPHF